MSLILQASGLGYRYPAHADPLFEHLDLTLYAGDHVALLGANGTGKTTLLRILAGTLPVQSGQLTTHIEPFYLRQEDALTGEASVVDAVLETYPDLGPLRAELSRLEAAGVPDPLRYADLLAEFAEGGGFVVEVALQAELAALGYAPDELLARPLTDLSGGERRLLRLVAAFARPQALYLLDEPTNYLDERATAYLTRKLRETDAACLIVSHDRHFLDETVDGVLELERGGLRRYSGTYSSFWEQKETEYRDRARRAGKLKREITQLREQERTYKVWGARKEKEKSGAADRGFIGARAARLMRRGIQAKERLQGRITDLEEAKPWVEKRYEVAFEAVAIPPGACLNARDVCVLGRKVSLTLEYGERLAVAGANGAGKTTLLRALLSLTVNAGEVSWDKRAAVGYLPQRWDDLHDAEAVAARFARDEHPHARTLLGALGVSGEAFARPLANLSEGQKRKVRLVELIVQKPNVLILDEPTTHLDYVSVEMLEAALLDFPGTLILVSHDRYLLERTTTRRLGL
ncbi:MAG: COG0488: ATPase components of ABC transporters with duplicated ATPase domains [uncultured Truepera sp.]|uniref:COG0488: ATPase components of ABC transporters with duplicated ATPase domains n=1 Tax=uncultured Truepera sp. TaxID=543023 RepID=A0A6J4VJ12_9DEIN|nr:MAG: COG0488: ATPase components of ABC transporters with duplicated ATPase domains [uncultured Truepera sp.]